MSDDLDYRLKRLEEKDRERDERYEDYKKMMFGEHGKGGFLQEVRDELQSIKAEHKFLRYTYILLTALIVPLLQFLANHVFAPLAKFMEK